MRPEECVVGESVMYFPSLHGPGFVGEIAAEPWQLGSGHWVTKLKGMDEGYAKFTGKSGDKAHTVFAASLLSCEAL